MDHVYTKGVLRVNRVCVYIYIYSISVSITRPIIYTASVQVYTTSVAHDMLYQLAGVEQKRQALCSSVGRGAPVLPVWSSELFTLDLRKKKSKLFTRNFPET